MKTFQDSHTHQLLAAMEQLLNVMRDYIGTKEVARRRQYELTIQLLDLELGEYIANNAMNVRGLIDVLSHNGVTREDFKVATIDNFGEEFFDRVVNNLQYHSTFRKIFSMEPDDHYLGNGDHYSHIERALDAGLMAYDLMDQRISKDNPDYERVLSIARLKATERYSSWLARHPDQITGLIQTLLSIADQDKLASISEETANSFLAWRAQRDALYEEWRHYGLEFEDEAH